MKFSFSEPGLPKSGTAVVTVLEGGRLCRSAADLDERTGGTITRALTATGFTGERSKTLSILAPAGLDLDRILLVGLGAPASLTEVQLQELGATVIAELANSGSATASVFVDPMDGLETPSFQVAAQVAFGAKLRSYRFDKYRTTEKKSDKPSLKKVVLLTEDASAAKKAFAPLNEVAEGVFLARDLVSEPGNVLYPETMADRAKELGALGVEIEILDEKKMRKLGMGALLGVAQGSVREPKLVIMKWQGDPNAEDQRPVAFVGKGVTFDTGGISLKPPAGMEEMKWDMGGAAAVMGLMRALAGRKARANVVGIVGLVENMPDGNAQRPGDVVTSMSGQTIEVINTDAEGRLVLADALWYCHQTFKPKFMIDLATLTGAIIISLGDLHAGMFASDDGLAAQLLGVSSKVAEPVWRFPMSPDYDKALKSGIADMRNVSEGRAAGSIVAAQFLRRFTNDVPWAHLDIAGVAWLKKDRGTVPKGGTGFGVRLLDRLIADHYER